MTPTPETTRTLETLQDLSSEYQVTPDQIEAYQRDGHVLLRGVCSSSEVAAYRQVFRDLIEKHYPEPPKMEDRDVFNKAFLSLSNNWVTDEIARPFVFARRFARIAAELMGVDGVRLYHNQVFFKEPGGGPTPWHQDHFYWPLETPHMTTCWMPLVDVTPAMGALRFAAGSHQFPFLDDQGITADAMAHFDKVIADRGFPVITQPMQAGDASFHTGWTLHSAAPNGGEYAREVSAVSYYADGAHIMTELTPARQADLEACAPGVGLGQLADGPRNPLLYHKQEQEQ